MQIYSTVIIPLSRTDKSSQSIRKINIAFRSFNCIESHQVYIEHYKDIKLTLNPMKCIKINIQIFEFIQLSKANLDFFSFPIISWPCPFNIIFSIFADLVPRWWYLSLITYWKYNNACGVNWKHLQYIGN